MSKYTNKDIFAKRNEIYEDTNNKIRKYVKGICMYRWNHTIGKFVAKIVIVTLHETDPGKNFLLHSNELANVIALQYVNYSIKQWILYIILYTYIHSTQQSTVLLSDTVPYMVKSSEAIKLFYTKVIHAHVKHTNFIE